MRATCSAVVPLLVLFLGSMRVVTAQESPSPEPTQKSTPSELVDALNGVFGKHPGARAVHPKGIVLEGMFKPSSAARSISKAPHLQKTSVPVVVRFSDFAGIPTVSDPDPHASPRGLAVKFMLQNGKTTDIVAHSFNGFPSPTTDDFRDLLIAIGASGADAQKPTKLDAYLQDHPVAKAFLTSPKPAPESYGTLPYFGVNAFKFVNAKGGVTVGRYQFQPLAGDHYLSNADLAKAGPDYLQTEIRDRVRHGPVKFKLLVQVAQAGDRVDDPSIAWPDNRRTVELGSLSIDRVVADSDAAQAELLFLPNALPDGIEVEDPMVSARSAAYPVSFARRHGQ
jgi:catalase